MKPPTKTDSSVTTRRRPIRAERQRIIMIHTFFASLKGRMYIFLAIFLAILLAACGGGGGGSPVDPVPPVAEGNLNGTVGCDSPEFGVGCALTVAWGSSNATALAVKVNGVTIATKSSDSVPVTMGLGDYTVTLMDGSTELARKTVSASCASGLSNQAGTCVGTTVPNHGQLVLAINTIRSDLTLPLVVVNPADGSKKVLDNESEFQSSPSTQDPIRLCGVWVLDRPAAKEYTAAILPDGQAVINCQARFEVGGPTNYNFRVNPVTGKLGGKYAGAVPTGSVLVFSPDGTASETYPSPIVSLKGTNVKTGEVVNFLKDTGNGLWAINGLSPEQMIDPEGVRLIVAVPER